MNRKLDTDSFYAQFHNHEKHLTDQEHEYVPSDVAYPEKTASRHPHPNYSKKKKRHRSQAVHKAIQLTVGH